MLSNAAHNVALFELRFGYEQQIKSLRQEVEMAQTRRHDVEREAARSEATIQLQVQSIAQLTERAERAEARIFELAQQQIKAAKLPVAPAPALFAPTPSAELSKVPAVGMRGMALRHGAMKDSDNYYAKVAADTAQNGRTSALAPDEEASVLAGVPE